MDVVIPLGKGSKWANNELRYALRSIVKFAKGFDKVWIIGECPDWITNVEHIPAKDKGHKEGNIMNKTLLACERISGGFLFTNDDIFFTRDVDITTLPYYRRSRTLSECIKDRGKPLGAYHVSVRNTAEALTAKGYHDYHFDTHVPIIYNSDRYIDIMAMYDWKTPKGYVIKSLYTNSLGIEGEVMEDMKVKTYLNPLQISDIFARCPFVSVGDNGLNVHMRGELERLFTERSIYET